jgi:hypothetical protein
LVLLLHILVYSGGRVGIREPNPVVADILLKE